MDDPYVWMTLDEAREDGFREADYLLHRSEREIDRMRGQIEGLQASMQMQYRQYETLVSAIRVVMPPIVWNPNTAKS